MLKKLWQHLSLRRKKQFGLIVVLMLLASLAEMLSIGAVLPFLGVLAAPEEFFLHPIVQTIINFCRDIGIFVIMDPDQIILLLSIIFIVVVLLAGAIRVMLLYVMTRFSHATGADLGIDIYRRTLYQEYSVHISRNSSEVIDGVIIKTNAVIGAVLNPILMLISSVVLLIGIIIVLFVVNIKVAIAASICFGTLYLSVILYTRVIIRNNSQIIADQSIKIVKSLQEGLGGVRDVIIDGTQQFYCDLYRSADLPLRRATGSNIFISGSPRYVMESIGMSLIVVLAYALTQSNGDISTVIPVLGAFALGAQRLLPALQQAYGAYSSIKGAKSSFDDVINLLDQTTPCYADLPPPLPLKFEKSIRLNNLSFYYRKDTPCVMRDINIKITKGSRVGFMGVTGSGKSTLLDIVMGLLQPTSGEVTVDGQLITVENRRAWQAHISHVPQNIYLSDGTVEENIAFGLPKDKIDYKQVVKAAEQAQVAKLIDSWKEGYQTFVGERGIKLSGGQRQRIGIARALYKQADVLIFDEATSALDYETERAVIDAIESLSKGLTILIIAHRLSTLKWCDQIIKLEKNTVESGSYEEMILR